MNTYIIKDGTVIEAIPIGKAKMKIGDVQVDGKLTICDRAPNLPGYRYARAICRCECGNYTVIRVSEFYHGTTKSCGCYNRELHRELGKKLGEISHFKNYSEIKNPYYNFIEKTEEKDSCNSFYWIIECKCCHNRYKAVPAQLISNTRRKGQNPCNCWKRKSKGILKIQQILTDNNVKFIQEFTFKDCLSSKGNLMKFDFFLPEYDILVEYDGEQHFLPMTFGDTVITGEDKLSLTQKYDEIKNKYCEDNNIKLIRIPYTRYNELCLEDLIGGNYA